MTCFFAPHSLYYTPMEDCLFCKIIAGAIPAHTVYEDEHTVAFLDINPVNHGHTLVVPKTHSRNVFDIAPNDWRAVAETVRVLSTSVKEGVGADGINIEMNNERPAGQLVFHTHVHIVPRRADDGLRHWPGTPYGDGEAEDVAARIRRAIERDAAR